MQKHHKYLRPFFECIKTVFKTMPQCVCSLFPTCDTCHAGSSGSVRLIGGLIPQEGTVQVCVNAVWSSVCPSYWDYKDAFVVCRQLGYPATGEND